MWLNIVNNSRCKKWLGTIDWKPINYRTFHFSLTSLFLQFSYEKDEHWLFFVCQLDLVRGAQELSQT